MQKKLSPWCKKAKIAMIQNDISVNDLAEELGCSRCYLSSTLNGKNTSIEIRRRITSDAELLEELNNMESVDLGIFVTQIDA